MPEADQGSTMRVRAVLLATVLVLAPFGVRAADLVVWWEKGFYPGEDGAIEEIIAAFENKTGKHAELAFVPYTDLTGKVLASLKAEHPPDFLYGSPISDYFSQWAYEGRLVDLADALGPMAAQFDQDALGAETLLDDTTGRRGLYALPMGLYSNHVHVWKNLLERAGFTLADVPKEWDAFWSFWCDTAQPALRKAIGRGDVWGVGLPMSVTGDTAEGFLQFRHAYEADYATREGRLVIDQPQVRAGLVRALDSYTALYRKGCIPPDAVDWDNASNNKAFLAQTVLMTVNNSLSIPGALKATRPEDYTKNSATILWPDNAYGRPLVMTIKSSAAAVFKNGGHVATAKEFVHFLVAEGWLAHWLDFAGDRYLPPFPALLEQPFWLDPGDPHRMTAAMQYLTRPHDYDYAAASGEWRHRRVAAEQVWPEAIRRSVTEGISSEQAVDEAITRIHQILAE